MNRESTTLTARRKCNSALAAVDLQPIADY